MATGVKAQKADTLAIFKQFIAVCNGYKQLPLYMEVDFSQQTNIPRTSEDTINTTAVFNIQSGGAYIKFGPFEQIATDSIVLTVMENVKQMIVSESGNKVTELMRLISATGLTDTSARKMAAKYTAISKTLDNGKYLIGIFSRKQLPGITDPQEEVLLIYNGPTGLPESMTTIKRTLAADQKYEGIDEGRLAQIKKVSFNGKDSLLVKESRTKYDYRIVSHESRNLAVKLSDRIELNEEKAFVPIKTYSEYSLIIN